MWITLVFAIFFTLQFINMILIIYVTLSYNPSAEYPPFPFYFFTPSLPYSLFIIIVLFKMYTVIYLQYLFAYNGQTNQNNQLWLGGSKLHSKLWTWNKLSENFAYVVGGGVKPHPHSVHRAMTHKHRVATLRFLAALIYLQAKCLYF